jgi:ABC-type transport system substrate-binding protein/DNA-binding SARP family transcriptional activator
VPWWKPVDRRASVVGMRFAILGPLEVEREGAAVSIPAAKQRALLIALLLRRAELVPTDTLVEEIWDGGPPPTAVKALQTYVSHLRKVLGPAVLETRATGYLIRAEPSDVDASDFEALLEQAHQFRDDGDTFSARETLQEALALWRGPALADVRDHEFARAEATRLDELRLLALEQRIACDLALGRHAEVVSELDALVHEHPLRESLRGTLMVALYRAGRHAEALAVYRDGRTRLMDDLGLEPGGPLRDLETAILRHDASLAAPRRSAPVLDAKTRTSERPRTRHAMAAAIIVLLAAAASVVVVLTRASSPRATRVVSNSVGVLHATGTSAAGDVPLAATPTAVAVGFGAVWVASADHGTLIRVDPAKGVAVDSTPVGDGPAGVAVANGFVWVTNGLDGTVSRVDPSSGRQVQVVAVGNGPEGITYGAGALWVANSVDGTVTRIDPVNGRPIRTFPAIVGACAVAVGFGRVWVVSRTSGAVVALDPTSGVVVDRVEVGVDPDAVAVGAGAVWIANRADGTLSRIAPTNPARVTEAIPVEGRPVAVAVSGQHVWVADASEGVIVRVDTLRHRVVEVAKVGNAPRALAVDGPNVYAAVQSGGLEHRGGTLRVVAETPVSLDPALAYSDEAWPILSMTNDGLVAYRRVGGIEGVELVPDLATSLPTPTDGGATYTFQLRPGIHYSSGRLVSPYDIRNSLQRAYEAPSSPARQYFGAILGTNRCRSGSRCDLSRGIVIDAHASTITFHLTHADGDFLAELALPFAYAVPSEMRSGTPGVIPATGPYMVASFSAGREARLVRNPRYRQWSTDAQPDGYPNAISFKFVPDGGSPAVMARDVDRGRSDVAPNLSQPPFPETQLTNLIARDADRVHLDAFPSLRFFFLNTSIPPFNDVRVRRAVNDAFDRQAFARMLGPSNTPTCQLFPPDFPSYKHTCPYANGGAQAVIGARRVIRDTGHAGQVVKVWAFEAFRGQARYMTSVLNAIGFHARAKVLPQNPAAYFQKINDSRTHAQIGWYGWVSDFPSESGFLAPMVRCSSFVRADPNDTYDASELCDPKVDRLIVAASAAKSQNPAAAPAIWQRAERQVLSDAPFVPTYNVQDVSLVSPRVGDFQYHPEWGVLLDRLWVR